MTKALVKAIMTRSRLKSADLKSEYFRNLNINDLNENKKFWKKIKPSFSDKGLQTNNSKKKRINY